MVHKDRNGNSSSIKRQYTLCTEATVHASLLITCNDIHLFQDSNNYHWPAALPVATAFPGAPWIALCRMTGDCTGALAQWWSQPLCARGMDDVHGKQEGRKTFLQAPIVGLVGVPRDGVGYRFPIKQTQ